jgi:ankyrin repeat protein
VSRRYDSVLAFQERDGSFPLHMAIRSRAPRSVLEMLIKEDPDSHALRNKFGETPLHVAIKQDAEPTEDGSSDDVAEFLLQLLHPDVVRIRDARGNLPLHVAAVHGCSVHVAKGLLEAWPESILERSGEPDESTPLELAIQRGKCDEHVLRLLSISADEAVGPGT